MLICALHRFFQLRSIKIFINKYVLHKLFAFYFGQLLNGKRQCETPHEYEMIVGLCIIDLICDSKDTTIF